MRMIQRGCQCNRAAGLWNQRSRRQHHSHSRENLVFAYSHNAVHKAKHNRTRLVPMSQSLAARARCYAATVGLVAEDPGAWFFPSPRGGGYNPGSATAHIQGLMLQAGITAASGRAPRAHDLRHSYAVACLAKMQAGGVDVYATLPLLARMVMYGECVTKSSVVCVILRSSPL